jgi:hypothetical protein
MLGAISTEPEISWIWALTRFSSKKLPKIMG